MTKQTKTRKTIEDREAKFNQKLLAHLKAKHPHWVERAQDADKRRANIAKREG